MKLNTDGTDGSYKEKSSSSKNTENPYDQEKYNVCLLGFVVLIKKIPQKVCVFVRNFISFHIAINLFSFRKTNISLTTQT